MLFTSRQADKQTNATENITFAKDVKKETHWWITKKHRGSGWINHQLFAVLQCTEVWRECEVDIMYNFIDLPVETRDVIESVEGKPGFVKLPYDPIYPKYIEPFLPETYRRQPNFIPVS